MIDVLMSVRNNTKFVAAAIESIICQTIQEFTLYVVDDASTDDSAKIIKSFSDKRIVFFENKKPKGLTKNLNFLLSCGYGEFVARHDADDVSRFDRFSKQIDYLQKKSLDLVGSDANVIDAYGKICGTREYKGSDIKKDLIEFNMFPHSSWFGKRRVFEKLGGYDETYIYAQDYDFLFRAAQQFKLGIIKENLIDFRFTNDSISAKNLKKQQYYSLLARKEAIKRGDFSKLNYLYLVKPLISYLLPVAINKNIYKLIYGY